MFDVEVVDCIVGFKFCVFDEVFVGCIVSGFMVELGGVWGWFLGVLVFEICIE